MKTLNYLLLSVAIAGLTACSSNSKPKKKKVDKKELYGSMENRTYSNSFFHFELEFDPNWEFKGKYFQTGFGGDLIEANYRLSENPDYPVNVTIEIEKTNPFQKANPIEYAQEQQEGYDLLYEDDEIVIRDLRKQKIAGEDFVRNEILLITEGDTSYINDYVRAHEGYYLMITTIANNSTDQKTAEDLIQRITKKP